MRSTDIRPADICDIDILIQRKRRRSRISSIIINLITITASTRMETLLVNELITMILGLSRFFNCNARASEKERERANESGCGEMGFA